MTGEVEPSNFRIMREIQLTSAGSTRERRAQRSAPVLAADMTYPEHPHARQREGGLLLFLPLPLLPFRLGSLGCHAGQQLLLHLSPLCCGNMSLQGISRGVGMGAPCCSVMGLRASVGVGMRQLRKAGNKGCDIRDLGYDKMICVDAC